jgi:serine/threonine protein kinase
MLTLDPSKRITAQEALQHQYFKISPEPCEPSKLPLPKPSVEPPHKKMKVNESTDHLEYSYKMVEGISYIHGGLYILKQLDYPASLYETI